MLRRCGGLLDSKLYVLRIPTRHLPKNPIKIRQTLKSTRITSLRHITIALQHGFCLINAVLIQKIGKSQPRHFFEITAKSRFAQM
jgi:hypothetical protein